MIDTKALYIMMFFFSDVPTIMQHSKKIHSMKSYCESPPRVNVTHKPQRTLVRAV